MKDIKLIPLLVGVLMSGCSSNDKINETITQIDKDYEKAKQQIRNVTTSRPVLIEAQNQWINPVPLIEQQSTRSNVPACSITINRQGNISIHEIAQRITGMCRIPVTVTPDAVQFLGEDGGNKTQKITGSIPAPDESGMMPLASMGGSSRQKISSGTSSHAISGLYWKGPLSGFLDSIASRFGLSWRYERDHIYFHYLETRSFPIAFMDSLSEFHSKVVSGTTSSSGNSGGTGGNSITGDASTSQTTTTQIKSSLYADLQEYIKTMLTPGMGRMFLTAGSLTVTDAPQVLNAVDRFITDRNKEMNRQVVLSVEVLRVEKRNKNQLGIDWKAVFNSGSLGLSLTNTFAGAAENVITGGVNIVDGKLAGSTGFVRALSEQAKVSVVTQQSSTTTNMTPLPMQVAEQEDYVAKITTETTANVGTSTSINPATITTGFNMTLLPYIMPNSDKLQLQFSVSLSDPPSRRTFTSGESSVELLNTKLKTVNQRVNMKSGQTIVLSGFQQVSRKGGKQGVITPWFFGLGGGRNAEDGDTMLVILITPTILKDF